MPYAMGLPFVSGAGAHTSRKAAVRQRAKGRGAKTQRYLGYLYDRGPRIDHDSAADLGWPLSSICSIRNGAMDCGLVGRGVAIKRSRFGEDCFTWMLTAAGRSAVEAMREAA